jgi:hypothetical protein
LHLVILFKSMVLGDPQWSHDNRSNDTQHNDTHFYGFGRTWDLL